MKGELNKPTQFIIKAIAIAFGVIVILGVYGFIKHGTQEYIGNSSEPSMTTAEYKRIGVKACVKEATDGTGVTEEDANTYCVCAMNRVYGNKSLAEMRDIDADFIKNGMNEKYDQVMLDCIELIQDNYL